VLCVTFLSEAAGEIVSGKSLVSVIHTNSNNSIAYSCFPLSLEYLFPRVALKNDFFLICFPQQSNPPKI
jgi:hypothetical protein